MQDLARRNTRLKVLRAIYQYQAVNGRSPSMRELLYLTGLKSSSSVARHVANLKDTGYIEKQAKGEPRSLVLTEKAERFLREWA